MLCPFRREAAQLGDLSTLGLERASCRTFGMKIHKGESCCADDDSSESSIE